MAKPLTKPQRAEFATLLPAALSALKLAAPTLKAGWPVPSADELRSLALESLLRVVRSTPKQPGSREKLVRVQVTLDLRRWAGERRRHQFLEQPDGLAPQGRPLNGPPAEPSPQVLADRARVAALLKTLGPSERLVLALAFGLANGIPLAADEIGQRLGLTPQSVRAIRANALSALRKRVERDGQAPSVADGTEPVDGHSLHPAQDRGPALEPPGGSPAPAPDAAGSVPRPRDDHQQPHN